MEARNVKVSLETAKRWYEQGGEFKEMALSAFTEAELNPVRNEWESKFMENNIKGCYIGRDSIISHLDYIASKSKKGTFKTEKQAKSALAYAQLTQLMALPEYNGDWVPDWRCRSQLKHCIKMDSMNIVFSTRVTSYSKLSFKTVEIRYKFFENNYDLLKEYFELD